MSDKEPAVKPSSATPARRTQSERRAATRGALVAAARALFAERGFAGVSREEIVERAGVTRGAMYHYFASKEDLFRAVYEEVERDLCEAIAVAAMTAGDDPVEELRLGSVEFLRSATRGEVRRIAVLDSPAVLDAETRNAVAEQYGLGMLRAALAAVDGAGRLAAGPADQLAPMLMAVLHEAATQIADGADPATTIGLVEALLERITT
ncbi:MAG: TetR/AcrR family transcriptional regulator [Frankiaceae bacterium]|nr:TetR/AcrR family transcriptional regulator [Frankiaceae bacterium]MBV9872830.1 TetR/AcrR family transcriptional regulator [Frankiaceae bacterium]